MIVIITNRYCDESKHFQRKQKGKTYNNNNNLKLIFFSEMFGYCHHIIIAVSMSNLYFFFYLCFCYALTS